MSLPPIDWQPSPTKLARFSEVAMFALGMAAAPLAHLRGRPTLAASFWTAAVICRLLGAWRPSALKPVYLGLTLATRPIGWVVSLAALAVVYHGVVAPIALVLRLCGRDPLARRFDPSAATYWEPYNPSRGNDQYLKQF